MNPIVDALTGIAAADATIATLLLAGNADVRLEAAETALSRALFLSPHHAWAHMVLGVVQMGSNRAEQGIAEFEHALALNRNLVDAHACIGLAKIFAGRAAETEKHVHEALRLSPLDGAAHRWMSWAGLAKLLLGADAEAVLRSTPRR